MTDDRTTCVKNGCSLRKHDSCGALCESCYEDWVKWADIHRDQFRNYRVNERIEKQWQTWKRIPLARVSQWAPL